MVANNEKGEKSDSSEEEFPITTVMILVFIVLICVVLLLLYFFYKYLIYVVIGLFAIAAVSGTFTCLSAIMSFINCGKLFYDKLTQHYSFVLGYQNKLA